MRRPDALPEQGQLTGGIIHDIGKALGQQLGLPVAFVEVPRARYEEQLQAGTIDVVCITHPDWVRAPAELAWSPPLFSESDIIVQPAGTLPVATVVVSRHDLHCAISRKVAAFQHMVADGTLSALVNRYLRPD